MKKIQIISMFLMMVGVEHLCALSLGKVICRINMDKSDIYCTEEGEGPVGFSILDSATIGLWDGKRILLVTEGGKRIVAKNIGFEAAHFDFSSEGTGFCVFGEKLFRLNHFKAQPIPVKFSLEGVSSGSFRIDLINSDSVRFISQTPDFMIVCPVDSVKSMKLTSKIDTSQISIINNLGVFVGSFNGRHLFCRIDFLNSPNDWQVFEVTDGKNKNTKKIKVQNQPMGQPFLFSYPFRIDRDGNMYLMLKQNRDLVIWKLNYQEIFGQ